MDRWRESHKENVIDLGLFFKSLKDKWYYFFISVLLSVALTYLAIQFIEPEYTVTSTMLVRDESNSQQGAENLINGLALFEGKKNLQNEISILRSHSLIHKTIKYLGFEVSYFTEGTLRNLERYTNFPFYVRVDSNSSQVVDMPFHVKILSPQKFILEAKGEKLNVYDFKANKLFKGRIEDLSIYDTLVFAREYKHAHCSFTLYYNPNSHASYSDSEKFLFVIRDTKTLSESYQEKLKIAPIDKDASLLQLSVKGPVADKEMIFLNMLMNLYIERGLLEKNKIATNTISFIDQELNGISDSLHKAEDALEKFRLNNNLMNLSYEAQSISEKLKELESEKEKQIIKNKYYDYLLTYILENNIDIDKIIAPSTIGIQDPLLTDLISQLSILYKERSSLSLSAGVENPYISTLNLKIEHVKASLLENVKNIKNASELIFSDLESRIKETEKDISSLPQTERQLISIERKFNLNDDIYTYLLRKRAEANLAKAANIPDSAIIDPARMVGNEPVSPNKKVLMVLALGFAFIIPLGLILVANITDDKVRDVKGIQSYTPLKILGSLKNDKNKSAIISKDDHSIKGELLRKIAVKIQTQNLEGVNRIILFSSYSSNEGKSYCAANIASMLAIAGKKVLVLDVNYKNPEIHSLFGISNDEGMSDLYNASITFDKCIKRSSINNLCVIPSGPPPINPTELLLKSDYKKLFESLKTLFDYIIIDAPPGASNPELLSLLPHVNSMYIVVRKNYTKESWLNEFNELANNSHVKPQLLLVI